MLIKIGSLEIRTGKDANARPVQTNRDDIPQLSYDNPSVTAANAVTVFTKREQPVAPPKTGLAFIQKTKPHPMTRAIEWPSIPEDPMDQTRLSILVTETDKWFRKHGCVNICPIRDYVEREGIVLYGDAKHALDTLQELHCKDFDSIHPTVLQAIPAMYTAIFRAGDGEFNVNDAWRI